MFLISFYFCFRFAWRFFVFDNCWGRAEHEHSVLWNKLTACDYSVRKVWEEKRRKRSIKIPIKKITWFHFTTENNHFYINIASFISSRSFFRSFLSFQLFWFCIHIVDIKMNILSCRQQMAIKIISLHYSNITRNIKHKSFPIINIF